MQNLHADGLYHEPASKCNFDLNRQNTLLLNLFGTIGRKNTTLDGMYHMLLVTVQQREKRKRAGEERDSSERAVREEREKREEREIEQRESRESVPPYIHQ